LRVPGTCADGAASCCRGAAVVLTGC
jgi:hypothetical protein